MPDHQPLAGEVVVFTGRLTSLRRKEAHALVARLGGASTNDVTARTTMLVVGAGASLAGSAAADGARRARKAEQVASDPAATIRLVSEDEFCAIVGLPSATSLERQFYGVREILLMYPALKEEHLRDLQKCNLVTPAARTSTERYFGFSDLLVIRQTSAELERGVSFKAVLRSLLASREGQLAFDFRLDTQPAKILNLRSHAAAKRKLPPGPAAPLDRSSVEAVSMAEQFFLSASELDDGDPAHQDAAAAVYRKALEADPFLVPALINLANIHYARDELAEAEALYERAIGLEADYYEAYFNLGNIHHDLGRFDEAQACYRRTISLNPAFAEAHLYLAVSLEKINCSEDAKPHWHAYQRLAPNGEWVELAREFSE